MAYDWALPATREGTPADDDLVARRAGAVAWQQPVPPEGVTCTDVTRGGVAAIECDPGGTSSTVLYLHGGGYRLGAASMWVTFGGRFAREASARVDVLEYRLAPEHPFPAALHDATAAYDELVAEGRPVVVAGDSAGGGLAAALTVACLRSGAPVPAGVIMISPWVDLTANAGTYESRAATDTMFSLDAAREGAGLYLQGVDANDPLASPVFADLAGFPPALLFAGGDEVLLADGIELASRLALAGTTVEAHLVAGMQHVWPTMQAELPESERALAAMARFVDDVTRA